MLTQTDLSTLANVVTTLAMMGRNRQQQSNNNDLDNSSYSGENYTLDKSANIKLVDDGDNVATTTNNDKDESVARAFDALSKAFHNPSQQVCACVAVFHVHMLSTKNC